MGWYYLDPSDPDGGSSGVSEGEIVWQSEEYSWQRSSMSYDGGSPVFKNTEEWYSPKITVLNNGNILAYDSVQHALVMRVGPAATSPGRSWVREVDIDTGATIWESEISGWAVTGVVERAEGGFWAAAARDATWYKPSIDWRASPAECTYILALNDTGVVQQSSWRVHTEAQRYYSSSYPFAMVPVSDSDSYYWIYGWKSQPNLGVRYPTYLARLRPQLDRVDPASKTDAQYNPEIIDSNGLGWIPYAVTGIEVVSGYGFGRPDYPMSLSATSGGGAIITYQLISPAGYYLAKIDPTGSKVWSRSYLSSTSGSRCPSSRPSKPPMARSSRSSRQGT